MYIFFLIISCLQKDHLQELENLMLEMQDEINF